MKGGKTDVVEVCERLNLACINRGPLAMGLLTGKYTAETKVGPDDIRGSGGEKTLFEDGRPVPEYLARFEAVRDVLSSGGRTLAQGALGWLWAVSDTTVPIPGCRTAAQIEENAGGPLQKGPLTAAQVEEIAKLLAATF